MNPTLRILFRFHAAAAFAIAILATMLMTPATVLAQVTDPGAIVGRVLDKVGGKYMASAVVRVAGTNWRTTTDDNGNYRLSGIPAGTYKLQASFENFNTAEQEVVVAPGQTVTVNFSMTSEIYVMDKMTVSSRTMEGQARALQEQRTSDQSKYVLAADNFGYMQDHNVGELLRQLPGVTTFDSDDPLGEPDKINIRGINDASALIMTDGNPAVSSNVAGDMTSDFSLKAFNFDNMESVELIKTPTPANPGAGLGGIVNFKSKSGFQTKGRDVGLAVRMNFIDTQVGLNARQGSNSEPNRQFFPDIGFNYRESFFEGTYHPVGVALSLGASRTGRFGARTTGNQKHVPNLPYGQAESPSDLVVATGAGWRDDNAIRESLRGSLTFDQQMTVNSSWFLRMSWNNDRQLDGGSRNLSLGTGALGPDTTRDTISLLESQSNNLALSVNNYRYDTQTWTINPGFKHKWGDFELSYDAFYGKSKTDTDDYSAKYQLNAGGNNASNRISFMITGVNNPAGASMTQLSGPSMSSLDNWGNMSLVRTNNSNENIKYGAKINATKVVSFRWPLNVQVGASTNTSEQLSLNLPQTYYFSGLDGVMNTPDDPALGQFVDFNRGGKFYYSDRLPALPWINPMAAWAFVQANRVGAQSNTKGLVNEDVTNYTKTLLNRREFKEDVVGAYFQGTININSLTIVTGARWEHIAQNGIGPYQNKTIGSPDSTDYIPDLVARNMAQITMIKGRQANDRWYPSITLKYEPVKNLIFQYGIWRTIGKVALSNVLPNNSYDPYASKITQNNPSILPQSSVNQNLDITYYIKNGFIMLTGYRYDTKNTVENLVSIIGTGIDNGFDGMYAGLTLTMPENVGKQQTQGLEFSFEQNLRWLPWLLQNLRVRVNATHMEKKRDRYGTGDWQKVETGFAANTANAFLSYNGRTMAWQVKANWQDKYDVTHDTYLGSNILKRRVYREGRVLIDVSASYKITSMWTASLNWSNVTREKNVQRFNSGLVYTSDLPFTVISMAITGKF